MGFLYQPDTVLTASDLETLAVGLLRELPLPGVEDCGFDSGIIWKTVTQAAIDQKSIKAVTDTTRRTYFPFQLFNAGRPVAPQSSKLRKIGANKPQV
jgi:hypothetical protein